jgi:hypothetical protein
MFVSARHTSANTANSLVRYSRRLLDVLFVCLFIYLFFSCRSSVISLVGVVVRFDLFTTDVCCSFFVYFFLFVGVDFVSSQMNSARRSYS